MDDLLYTNYIPDCLFSQPAFADEPDNSFQVRHHTINTHPQIENGKIRFEIVIASLLNSVVCGILTLLTANSRWLAYQIRTQAHSVHGSISETTK